MCKIPKQGIPDGRKRTSVACSRDSSILNTRLEGQRAAKKTPGFLTQADVYSCITNGEVKVLSLNNRLGLPIRTSSSAVLVKFHKMRSHLAPNIDEAVFCRVKAEPQIGRMISIGSW